MVCITKDDEVKAATVQEAGKTPVVYYSYTNKQTTNEDMNTTLNLTQEWDKTFPKSDKVDYKKVTFKNHTDLYDDKNNRIPYDKMEAFFRDNLK